MIGLIIFIISFFVASTGFFGGDIIYALDVLENWYYFVAVIIGIIAAGIMFGFTATGSALGSQHFGGVPGSFGGALAGYITGGFLAVLLLAKIAVQIWLVTWLMGSIDPLAVGFSGDAGMAVISTKETIAMVVLLILGFIGGGSVSIKSNNRNNRR